MPKVKYTEDHVRFILKHFIKSEELCVKETGHSLGSIKLMLQNIGATYGFLNFGLGNPMYSQIFDSFLDIHLLFESTLDWVIQCTLK